MEQRRGRGRSRGRASGGEGGGQRPGGPPAQPQGGNGGGGGGGGARGRGRGAPPPRPGGSAWGVPTGPPQQSAWSQGPPPGQGQPQGPPAQSSTGAVPRGAWGPPRLVEQQHAIRAPAPAQQAQQKGRAFARGSGDGPAQGSTREYEEKVEGGGDAENASRGPSSRGATRAGRRIQFENIIKTRPDSLPTKCGDGGRPVKLLANYFVLRSVNKEFMLYQYRVDFAPDTDMTPLRKQYLRNAIREDVSGYVFDGTVLYTPRRLHPDPYVKTVMGDDDEKITVTIKLVGDVLKSDWHYLQVFNLIMRKCIAALRLKLVNRNYFDPSLRVQVPDVRMELWPGYFTSIRQHERNIMMCVEITFKVMRMDTVLHAFCELRDRLGQNYKQEFTKRVVGTVVMTPYNNRFYRVDDVDFDQDPTSEFALADGQRTTMRGYYKEKYKIEIRMTDQPLLVSRAKKREIRAGAPETILLVPELCILTGLSEQDRANHNLTRALANHTRLDAANRIERINQFMNRINNSQEALKELRMWDMNFENQLVSLEGRTLDIETLLGYNGGKIMSNDRADWTSQFQRNAMHHAPQIQSWAAVVPQRCRNSFQKFYDYMRTSLRGMKWEWPQPKIYEIGDDRPQSYLTCLQTVIQQANPNIILCIVSNNKSDRYSAIKKKCSVENAIPSQVVCARTLDSKGGLSVATKVVIQMNCKIGGAPWGINIPAKSLMVAGYDACHDPKDKSKTFGAVVASLNATFSRYFSIVTQHGHGQELSDYIGLQLVQAVRAWATTNNQLPDRIVLYRDGVGEGQLNHVIEHEVQALHNALQKELYHDKPVRLAFIVVSKRIHTRFFTASGQNPPPGTVIDDVVTLPERYDFFLISQCVGRGTVSPTSYNIISDNTGFNASQLQKLSYKLCHGYYNWSGTIRVPAPCQYAHKLAFLVSQSLQRDPHRGLSNVLHYL